MSPVTVLPDDPHNRTLVENCAPASWKNPSPAPLYTLVVLGAGPAGLVAAAGAAGLGAKVALIEKHLLGGDCLNVGCVPSKAVIRAARAVGEMRRAKDFGVALPGEPVVDFAAAMERMRRVRAKISAHDAAKRFAAMGIDLFFGEPKFTGRDSVAVGGAALRFRKAVIATGARAAKAPVPGLEAAGYLTNETVFTLTERPRRLAVIGAGPIGCELAQAFRRLGSDVVLFDVAPQVLVREDADAAAVVQRALEADGVRLALGAAIRGVEKKTAGKTVTFAAGGKEETVQVDEILLGVGRAPNVEGLDLEMAGVAYDTRTGVKVDDRLRTSNPRVFAAGDVCMLHKFTHAADFAARVALQNALFAGRKKLSALRIPWCTYTDPEIAHVGLYERDAKERGLDLETYVRKFDDVDRAICDGDEEGFVKIHCVKGSDRIVGATIVASHAGEMIGEVALAMNAGVGLGALANVIHPYPTQAEAIRQCGDAYNRTRLTPFVKGLFGWWLRP